MKRILSRSWLWFLSPYLEKKRLDRNMFPCQVLSSDVTSIPLKCPLIFSARRSLWNGQYIMSNSFVVNFTSHLRFPSTANTREDWVVCLPRLMATNRYGHRCLLRWRHVWYPVNFSLTAPIHLRPLRETVNINLDMLYVFVCIFINCSSPTPSLIRWIIVNQYWEWEKEKERWKTDK